MSRPKKLVYGFCIVLIALAGWSLLSGPILIDMKTGSLAGGRQFTVFNPIRDRTPERYATQVLSGIQSDACEQAVESLQISAAEKAQACTKQTRDPISSDCRLVERSDKQESSWLLYHCPYRRPTEARAEVGLTLHKSSNQWQLHSYDRIY